MVIIIWNLHSGTKLSGCSYPTGNRWTNHNSEKCTYTYKSFMQLAPLLYILHTNMYFLCGTIQLTSSMEAILVFNTSNSELILFSSCNRASIVLNHDFLQSFISHLLRTSNGVWRINIDGNFKLKCYTYFRQEFSLSSTWNLRSRINGRGWFSGGVHGGGHSPKVF